MCLAVPGRVVEWIEVDSPFASARVEFGSVNREVSMACVPDAELGDFVLVHAGIAISRLDEREATRLLESLREIESGRQD